MPTTWNIDEVKRHISDQIEESLTLDYKAADACSRDGDMPDEITKDVSAMANSAGGTIIYGVKEFKDVPLRHRIEKLDPIDGSKYAKEWLEHIINEIRPRITGAVIYPIRLNPATTEVIYVVDIPQGTTAHQAKSFRYYRSFNFESVPMYDHEIRDVMNRATRPDAMAIFGPVPSSTSNTGDVVYRLHTAVRNIGPKKIDHFVLDVVFPGFGAGAVYYPVLSGAPDMPNRVEKMPNEGLFVSYRSRHPLLPDDTQDLSEVIRVGYTLNPTLRQRFDPNISGNQIRLSWKLLADDMAAKTGFVPIFPDLDHS